MELVFTILGLIFTTIGIISIYDARKLTKKLFSFQDINEGTKALKIFGLIISLIGLSIVFITFNPVIEMLHNL
jgi:multisubunit Na+/H+ antiporter MnhG subunit